ncbi:MAG: hypothetical protein WBM46_14690 [Polyangiales bacterium]|jgi:hypothetical protein
MKLNRRKMLYTALFGAGGLGLKSLATGIPMSVLARPLVARAQDAATTRILILSSSSAGDPINANVPGTYEDTAVQHSNDPLMAPTAMTIGGRQLTAAKPWAELPASILDKTVFFHHGTYTNAHPNHPKVMRLMGATERNEMVVSVYSDALSGALGTVQREPISVGARGGNEILTFQGRSLANVSPVALKAALTQEDNALGDLRPLRDQAVDELYALYQEHGTENQRRMLDRFVITRDEARSLSLDLVGRLSTIGGNGEADQVLAASVLAAMNVSPVITLRIDFGGDNHTDQDFVKETEESVTGVGHLRTLVETVDGMRSEGVLHHDVIVGTLNVFGRDLARKGREGRDHNGRHHCAVLIGEGLRGGVVGGIEPTGNDYQAQAIDSATGRASASGNIPHEETFQSMAKTLGVALGVPRARLEEAITGGTVIETALAG